MDKPPFNRASQSYLAIILLVTSSLLLLSCGQTTRTGSNKIDTASAQAKENQRIVAYFTPDSKNACQYNTPTIVGGSIYIGTSTKIQIEKDPASVIAALPESYFFKLDLDLKVLWQCDLGKSFVGGGASLDSSGSIYFTTLDFTPDTAGVNPGSKGYLTTVSLCSLTFDGKLRWKKQISAPNEGWIHAMLGCAIGTDDSIYVGDSKLFAFNQDGTVKWQYPQDEKIISCMRSSPIIDKAGNIYFISPEPVSGGYETDVIRAYKFSQAGGGTPVWSVQLGNNILDPEGGQTAGGGYKERWTVSTPAFTVGEKYLYAAVGNTINKVDIATGQVVWAVKPDGATGSFKASPAVDAQDNLYIGTKSNNEGTLYAIKADGSIIWKRVIGCDLYPSPLLGDDGKIYFGSETSPAGQHFHAADIATGAPVWDTGAGSNPLGDVSYCSPMLYQGYIYVGSFSVLASGEPHPEALVKIKIEAQGYLLGAAWPCFHGSNNNNGRTN